MTDSAAPAASDPLSLARAQRDRATDALVAALSVSVVEKLTAFDPPSSIVVGVHALGDDRQVLVEEVHSPDSIVTVSWVEQALLKPAAYEVDKLEQLGKDEDLSALVAELVELRRGVSVEGEEGQECFGYRFVDGTFEPVDLTNDGLHRLRWDSAIKTRLRSA